MMVALTIQPRLLVMTLWHCRGPPIPGKKPRRRNVIPDSGSCSALLRENGTGLCDCGDSRNWPGSGSATFAAAATDRELGTLMMALLKIEMKLFRGN